MEPSAIVDKSFAGFEKGLFSSSLDDDAIPLLNQLVDEEIVWFVMMNPSSVRIDVVIIFCIDIHHDIRPIHSQILKERGPFFFKSVSHV